MSQQCSTGCGRPTGRMLCEQCLWKLRRAVSDERTNPQNFSALVSELNTTLIRQVALTESDGRAMGSKGKESDEQPLPLNVQASMVLDDLRTYLVGWVRDIAETYDQDYPPNTLRAMARWIHARLDIVAVHSAAGDIWDEIVGAVDCGWSVVDQAADRTRFPVGSCPEATDIGTQCLGEIWAYIPATSDRMATLECRSCGTRWEPHQWHRLGRRIMAVVGLSTAKRRLSPSA